MAIIRSDQAGNQYILERGRYRLLTEDELALQQRPFAEVALESAGNLLQMGNALGVAALRPGHFQPGMQRFAEVAQQQQQISEFRPGAAATSEGLLELATGGLIGLAKPSRGVSALGRRAARGSDDAMAQPSKVKPPTPGGSGARSLDELPIGLPEHEADTVANLGRLAGNSPRHVGAMQRQGFWRRVANMPRFNGVIRSLEDFIGQQRNLTRDQQHYIDSGQLDAVGFRLLPGQRQGNDIISEVISRDPLMADAFDEITSYNSQQLAKLAAEAMRLPGADYGRSIRDQGRRRLGEDFERVASMVDQPVRLEDADKEWISKLLTSRQREALDIDDLRGQDAIDVFRRVSREIAALETNPEITTELDLAREVLDAVGDGIANAMSDPGGMRFWSDTRTRWRVALAFDRRGVITPEGDVSLKRLVNALETYFPKEFYRTTDVVDANLPPDVARLLRYARVSRAFISNLNDSGTATGNALLRALTHPREFMLKRAGAKMIRDRLLSDPYGAEAMRGLDDELIDVVTTEPL